MARLTKLDKVRPFMPITSDKQARAVTYAQVIAMGWGDQARNMVNDAYPPTSVIVMIGTPQ